MATAVQDTEYVYKTGILLDKIYQVTLHPSFCKENTKIQENLYYNYKHMSNGLRNVLLSNKHNKQLRKL